MNEVSLFKIEYCWRLTERKEAGNKIDQFVWNKLEQCGALAPKG
ncbi:MULTISPECIES: hypothetical protein [unclassified Proteus (in: enterobacteria)]|nr:MULTISPECIES: hypothetical protein [unclassified Proteus (in: enterobacteria)]